MAPPALLARLLCAVAILAGASARAATVTVLIPELIDDDPSEALKTRTTLLKATGAIQGLTIAPLSKLKKLAKTAKIDPKQLGTGPSAKVLCKLGKIDAVLAGVIEDLDTTRTLHLTIYDANGQVIFKRDSDLHEGDLRQDQITRITRGIATALGLDDTPVRRPVVADDKDKDKEADDSTGAEEPPPEREPVKAKPKKKAEPPPEINEEREEREASEPERPKHHRDPDADRPKAAAPTTDEQAHLERFEDPAFEVAVGAAGSSTSAQLVNNAPPTVMSNLASGFYPGFVARLQTFPFHDLLNPASGLGALATLSYGQISLSTNSGGSTSSFNVSDLRFQGLVDYRFRLPILSGDAAIFSPSLGARAGLLVSNLNAPAGNVAGLYTTDRLGFTAGGELVEPFGHYVRLIAGGQYYFSPYPGSLSDPNSMAGQLKATQVFSLGFDLDAEVQVHFSSPNSSGITGSVRFGYTQFADCFEQSSAGCSFNNTQTSIDFWLLLGYAFY